jgi:hypothetical protein
VFVGQDLSGPTCDGQGQDYRDCSRDLGQNCQENNSTIGKEGKEAVICTFCCYLNVFVLRFLFVFGSVGDGRVERVHHAARLLCKLLRNKTVLAGSLQMQRNTSRR